MKRRTFFGGLGASLAALAASTLTFAPRSVFARHVRQTQRRLNRNGNRHTERSIGAQMPYVALEDPVAFHELAEHVRLCMIERLREEGAPINVWRVGHMAGHVDSRIDFYTGEDKGWVDTHHFRVRTRVSVEVPPYDPIYVNQENV